MTINLQPQTLRPTLRFSEFKDGPSWMESKLGDIISTVTPPKKLLTASYLSQGAIPVIDQSPQAVCGWTDDVEAIVDSPLPVIVFGDHTCVIKLVRQPFAQGADGIKIFHSGPTVDTEYLFHNLSNRPLAMEDYKRHFSILKERRVHFPDPRTGEQRKIAACLTSSDELLAAEARKVEALRAHKKGLMQQLFPSPGEPRPRLRFREFCGAPDWESHTLGDVVSISKGKGVAKADITKMGKTPCIRYAELYTIYGEIISTVKSRTSVPVDELVLSEAGDVIIPASGETKEDIATCACVLQAGVALGGDLNVLRSSIDGPFFSYYLNGCKRTELAKVAQGDTVAHLYPSQISRLRINFPSDPAEQQRIAACLASLDALIAAALRKIDSLRAHKTGLMQQLFPLARGV